METLINKLVMQKWVISFKSKTAPRWLVLFADLVIVSFCFLLLAISDVFSSNFTYVDVAIDWVMVLVAYLLMILLTKTHTSIIRLSVIEDLYRVFKVVVLSTVVPLCSGVKIDALLEHRDSGRDLIFLFGDRAPNHQAYL